jgi:hypothetical protein
MEVSPVLIPDEKLGMHMRPGLYGPSATEMVVGTIETAMNGPNPYFERAREYDEQRTQESVEQLEGKLHDLETKDGDPPRDLSSCGEKHANDDR